MWENTLQIGNVVPVHLSVGTPWTCLPTPPCVAPGRNVSFAHVPRSPQRSWGGAHSVGAFLVTTSEPLASQIVVSSDRVAMTSLGSLLEIQTLRPQRTESESAFD